MIRRLFCPPVLAAVLLTATATAGEPSRTVALRCGRVLDVRSGALLRDQVVVVSGDRIVVVGPAASTPVPAGADVIDLSGATVLPGLIDTHTHLVDDFDSYDATAPLQKSGARMAFDSLRHAQATLLAGFTSVRDLGTYRAFVDVALRDAIERGVVLGPRLQPAGAYVTVSGGAGALTGLAPDLELPLELRFGVADGPDQVRQRVREIIRRGAGVIKVLATGAVLTPHSQPAAQEFTYEELRAAVEEAGKAGLKVAAHAHSAAGAKDAIRAGVASIEHGSFLDDEALRMMKERGVFLVPDLYNHEVILAGRARGYPEEFIEKERAAGESQRRVFRRALELGVRIAYGTDAAVIPHGDNARQFAVYVAHGMSPLAALRSATLEAAELLGWADRVGSLEPGKLADLIAVDGNPLEDVHVLERVGFVMKDGRVVKNEFR
ncbi:MAG: Xaa-Pro dipeptidase [Acidobacteria bacterium RIFCSPHIGHO2_12_FULL_67_30]|nr:MAG: Xaa-Pro dipeptidase [Acidobacteria bacterium RIFCSPHIGHO2_01_FULL_67_28]OFV85022.1 MAG: Xaa-Pro dipeptidase [Acidobacteria bacterium RIFCSPHIGHO2_02_FULL_67_57]OFV89631.1 MAG: Xaa-Pro dipeptidase [Acidobacteria bacterium RIFCSPHIGHO2_12_FULL_67_30]